MTKYTILKLLLISLKKLLKNDNALIELKPKEEAINHRLAVYLECYLTKIVPILYTSLNVDVEYDKSLECPKTDIFGKGIRPDILVHFRNSQEKNFLAIEAKKGYNTLHDRKKLEQLTGDEYRYQVVALVSYRPAKPDLILEVFNPSKQKWLKYSLGKSNLKLKRFKRSRSVNVLL